MKTPEIGVIIKGLRKAHPGDRAVVWSAEPFRVLVSTVLSQRTRDENTHIASERLFSKYDKPEQMAKVSNSEMEKLIKSAGFYREKAKKIKALSKIIIEDYGGKTPDNIDDLLKLPGVGRKTANCVLVYAYQKPAIPVDVHVHRISNRLGLVKTRNPEETEQELMKKIPKKHWIEINHSMVRFGQRICMPIIPKCSECPLSEVCPRVGVKKFS